MYSSLIVSVLFFYCLFVCKIYVCFSCFTCFLCLICFYLFLSVLLVFICLRQFLAIFYLFRYICIKIIALPFLSISAVRFICQIKPVLVFRIRESFLITAFSFVSLLFNFCSSMLWLFSLFLNFKLQLSTK